MTGTKRFGKGVLALGIAVVAMAVAAAAVAWWRWERVPTVAGGIPLPPGTEIVETRLIEGNLARCVVRCRIDRPPERVRDFFLRHFGESGWTQEVIENDSDAGSIELSKEETVVRVVLQPQKRGTYFTLFVKPCTQP